MKVLVAIRDFLKNLSCCHSSCMNQTIESNMQNEIKELTNTAKLLLAKSQHSFVRPKSS